jgi:hypothetical protein
MKVLFSILILICNSAILFAQANEVAGDYFLRIGDEKTHVFEYKLALHSDGTFSFEYYSNIKQGFPPEVKKYGKGKWTVENKVVSFTSDKQEDLDEKHTLDFTNSEARFVSKNPRDMSDQIVKTRLRFLESDIPWMKAIEIFKI